MSGGAMSRRRAVNADELALWERAMTGTAPLPGRRPPSAPPPAPPRSEAAAEAPAAPSPRRPAPRRATPPATGGGPLPLDPARPVGLDRRTWLRLKRGQHPIEARLDLHGLTQEEAHRRLNVFLAEAQVRGHRCVLVITGRGVVRGGVLRRMVPRWLAEPPNRDRVLSYSPARVQHGGEGALYLLVRRRGGAG
jgi:DNA-nicking Smr family endonuclease